MPLTVSVALALSVLGTSAPAIPLQPIAQVQTVKETVQTYFADAPIMADIAQCESHFRQYDANGSVFRGVQNNQDVGVMQINEHYHLETATKLGYNIYSVEGNMAYARYLYEHEGVTPWASSQPCWGKSKNFQKLAAK